MTFAGKLDGPGEYHANQNKSNPRKQRPNVFSGKWIQIHGGGGKNEGSLDCTVGSKGRGGDVGGTGQ